MLESNQMSGQLRIVCTDRAGRVHRDSIEKNRIVTNGRRLVAELFSGTVSGTPPVPVTHFAVGEGGTPPLDANTALQAQRGNRNPISQIEVTEFDEAGTLRVRVRLSAVFDFDEVNDASIPLREAGVFTAAAAGVMYNRVVFPPVTKTNAFRLSLFWDIHF